ncbi:MAG: hypothetical protein AAF958_14575 [Planctomycetota bacterium]
MVSGPLSSELYAELEATLYSGDIDSSLRLLQRVCGEFPDHVGAWELRGLLEAQRGRPRSAILYLNRAGEIGALETWSTRTLAMQYRAIDKTDVATDLLHSLGLHGDLGTGLMRRVLHDLIELRRPELAAQLAWHELQLDAKNAVIWHELAAAQSVIGLPPEDCLRSVQHAIEIAPEIVEYRVTASTFLIRMDAIREAYDVVCQVVSPSKLQLDCPCCLWRLICLFETFGDHDRMSLCYRKLRTLLGGGKRSAAAT